MGFFDNLSKKTTEFGKKTSEATSKIAKETKLKLKINENKGKIKDLYEEIGKKIYENHNGEIKGNEEFLKEKCTAIDELSTEIENARKEILVLNNKKICENCSSEIENNAAFCPKCGVKQEEVKSAIEVTGEKVAEDASSPNTEVKEEVKTEDIKPESPDNTTQV